jgi:hypothetical protein
MKSIFIILFICSCPALFATKYYVKTAGDNSKTGLSDAQAWSTLAKVNGFTFGAGDTIYLNKGDTWREELVMPRSGTSGAYMFFTSYGNGANPRILGSTAAVSWTNTSGNIWQSATTFASDPYNDLGSEIFFENLDGSKTNGIYTGGTLTAEFEWKWAANKISVYAATDPGTRYTSVEVPVRESTVNMNKKNYIHFSGIDMLYSYWSGYGYDWTHNDMYEQFGLIIENSEICCIGAWDEAIEQGYGIEVVYTNMTVRNNKFHDCGRRGFAMDMYGNSFTSENIVVDGNEFYNGFHTTGCDIDVGAGYDASLNNITVRNNYFHETSIARTYDVSNLIFVQNNNVGGSVITNLYIYDNIFKWPNGYAILMESAQSVYIYNNVFYDQSTNAAALSLVAVQGSTVATVKNNVFYKSSGNSTEFEKNGSTTNDYNLYYNCVISSGTEAHGIFGDNPDFVSSTNFNLQAGSPAIGAGVYTGVYATDYAGNTWLNPPSIGAYEYGSGVPTSVYKVNASGKHVRHNGKILIVVQ